MKRPSYLRVWSISCELRSRSVRDKFVADLQRSVSRSEIELYFFDRPSEIFGQHLGVFEFGHYWEAVVCADIHGGVKARRNGTLCSIFASACCLPLMKRRLAPPVHELAGLKKFGSRASKATVRTGLGGDLSPLERLSREGMRVYTGFSWKTRLCAKFADFGR